MDAMIPNCKSVLLKVSKLEGIENYIHVVYMQQRNQIHTYFVSVEKRINRERLNQQRTIQKKKMNFENKTSNNKERKKDTSDPLRIAIFINAIQDSSYCICVVCNRCNCRCLVLQFDEHRYVTVVEGLNTEVSLFERLLYVCKTCDKRLKFSDVLCQVISNKLEIFGLSKEYLEIGKLEKVQLGQFQRLMEQYIMLHN